MDMSHRRPRQMAEQYAPQSVAQSQPEALLQWFGDEAAVVVSVLDAFYLR